uniref:Transmembrane protein n=1 Tax=Arabidopsis thaliana TaxID=3702 RepID=Q9LTN9_ARATH|nr:unnamed protein product [Arabidopsis thaliana]
MTMIIKARQKQQSLIINFHFWFSLSLLITSSFSSFTIACNASSSTETSDLAALNSLSKPANFSQLSTTTSYVPSSTHLNKWSCIFNHIRN